MTVVCEMSDEVPSLLETIIAALNLRVESRPRYVGSGELTSVFRVGELAQASIGAAGASLASLIGTATESAAPEVVVSRPLSIAWFQTSLRPVGWQIPPAWDSLAGDYRGRDGWIRLHTNAPHHRRAALSVLKAKEDLTSIASEVANWPIDQLEEAIVAAGGASAAMRSIEQWSAHAQGRAVAHEPLLDVELIGHGKSELSFPGLSSQRPLRGIRILDLTRVLAGPVATRTLAGWGASVLRIDPPDWDEPGVIPEVMVGKRSARLDLRASAGRDAFLELLSTADVLIHGYRPDALDDLGLGRDVIRAARPGLVDVSLDAYGWSGPWKNRRGFDSLVQMSSGIAHAAMTRTARDVPVPLPVQALDHATGYLVAAATISGLTRRLSEGTGSQWRTSLARVAKMLVDAGPRSSSETLVLPEPALSDSVEDTSWGPAHRLIAPVEVTDAPLKWDLPSRTLGGDDATWRDEL